MTTQVSVIGSQPSYATSFVWTSGADSAAVDLKGKTLMGLIIPAGFSGTSIKFKVSNTLAGTYATLTKGSDGSDISITVAAGKPVAFDNGLAAVLSCWRFVTLTSGSSETAKTAIAATRVV